MKTTLKSAAVSLLVLGTFQHGISIQGPSTTAKLPEKEAPQDHKVRFKVDKLVRDNFVEFMTGLGGEMSPKTMDHQDFIQGLKTNLLDEAKKVANSTDKTKMIEELADTMEVLTALAEAHGISMEDISQFQDKKRVEYGSYKTKTYIDFLEAQEDSPVVQYCKSKPNNYLKV